MIRNGNGPRLGLPSALLLAVGALLSGAGAGSPSTGTGEASCHNVTGVWHGAMSYLDASRPIEFTLADDGGVLAGHGTIYDPDRGTVAATIPLSGKKEGCNAHWSTLGGSFVVTGAFVGAAFNGSIAMPDIDGGSFKVAISLSRIDGGTPTP